MSVDWNVLCDKCKQYHHLGQDMGGICSFGYDSRDKDGPKSIAEFISQHIDHNFESGEQLRIVITDNVPIEYENVEGR